MALISLDEPIGNLIDLDAPDEVTEDAVPEATAGSVLSDVAAGALQIGPTAIKGVADIARLATGDRIGKDTSEAMDRGMGAIRDMVGSKRAKAQRSKFEADMANDNVSIGDALLDNKGALADQVLPTIGSMFLPVGAAGAAGKLAGAGKAVQAMDKAALAARVASAQKAAGIGSATAQNAASTFAELVDKGTSMEDAYLAAGITVPFSVVSGVVFGGGAEVAAARALTKTAAGKTGALQVTKATGREGGQEIGEETGQITGESVATGVTPSATSIGKQLAVAGTLGAVMGGGVDVASQFSNPVAAQLKEQIDKGNSPLSRAAATNPNLQTPIDELPPNGTLAPDASPSSEFFDAGAPNGLTGSPAQPDQPGLGSEPSDPAASLGAGPGAVDGSEIDGLRTPTDDLVPASGLPGEPAAEPLRAAPGAALEEAPIIGEPINRTWTAFHPESGTLNIPREQMPQIKSEHRGSMVQYLKAKGVDHENDIVPAESLKPTQDKFSPAKVKQAIDFEGADRAVLISSDGYVLDGHHQWLAKAQQDAPVKVIRLNAPIAQLLTLMETFPSAGMTKLQDSTSTEKANEPQTPVTEQTTQKGSQASAEPAAPVARTQVAAPQTVAAAPASPTNTGTAQVRKRRAQLAHMAGRGFTELEERDGVTWMVNPKQNAEMPLGSSIDVAWARQAVVAAGGKGDTVQQTTGVQNGQSIGAAGGGVDSGAVGSLPSGRANGGERPQDKPTGRGAATAPGGSSQPLASAGSGGQLAGGTGTVSAGLEERDTDAYSGDSDRAVPMGDTQRSDKDHAREQLAIARLRARNPSSRAVNPQDPGVAELRTLLAVFERFSGKRGYVIHDNRSDGMVEGGDLFVSVDRPHMHVAWTVGHEFSHFSERYPGIKALYDSIWKLIDNEAGKSIYYAYLARTNESLSGSTYQNAAPWQLDLLKKEMVADFLGARLWDKAWLTDISRKKPDVFGKFVKEWVPLLGSIIRTLQGLKEKMTGVKNVDQYISKLQEAKDIAQQVLEIWAKERPGYAQRSQVQNSAKEVDASEDIDLDFMAELQAELDQEQAQDAPDESVSDDQIEAHGLQAEDAFPPLFWEKKSGGLLRTTIPDLYTKDNVATIQLEPEGKGLFGGMMRGTWIGPANTETVGYATLKGAQDFVRRYVASKDLRDRKFDLLSAVSPEEKQTLVKAWKSLNKLDGVQRYGAGEAGLPMKAIAQKMGITRNYDVRVRTEVMDKDAKTIVVEFTNLAKDHYGEEQMAILELNRVDGRWLGTANTSGLNRGGMGAATYQLFTEYAASRDIAIHPDHSLSGINTYRRTEQMLSAAMRIGKSNTMVPHPVQRVYGFNNNASTPKEHDDNVARLLLAGLRNVRELVPEMDKLVYHPETDAITNEAGRGQEAYVRKLLKGTDARAFGVGRSTLARAIMTRMVMEGKTLEPKSFKNPVLYSARDTAELEYQMTLDRYKGTSQWMKAPNGAKTKLTERQWVQTRTPSFKRWFGDFEKGNVWARDDVSKAVDANGDPQVLYHGTDTGGFYKFKQPGGTKRGDLGIFTTDNRNMAKTYIRRGREQDITPPQGRADLEARGYQFEEGFRIQEKFYDTQDEALADQDFGDEIEPAVRASNDDSVLDGPSQTGFLWSTVDQAVDTILEDFENYNQVSTIYAVFANIRNPNEDDFEGAMWSGSREHLWQVVVGGETQTASNGSQYFTEDEARDLAKIFAAPDDEYEGADYLQAADDHWIDTDGIVKEARRSGNDGAIVRNVVDSGGGDESRYDNEPSDVFVAFEPNQLKSADFNSGEFGETDYIQRSQRDAQLSVEFKPGFSTGLMTEMNTELDSNAQKGYLIAMRSALRSNVPSVQNLLGWGKRYGEVVTGGAWKALSGWSIQATLSLPDGIIDAQTEHEINFFLATHGMWTSQEAMAWHLPKFGDKGVGVEFNLGGKKLSAEQFEEVYASVMHEFKNYSIPPIPSKDGLRFLNYTGLKQDEFLKKLKLAIAQTSVHEIWEKTYHDQNHSRGTGQADSFDGQGDGGLRQGPPDLSRKSGNDDLSAWSNEGIRQFSHKGNLIENNWRAGENQYRELIIKSWEYLKDIPGSKMPQTLEALNDYLTEQQDNADGVNQFFAEEFGLSKPTLSKEERATGVKENYEFPPRNTFKTVRAKNAFFKNPDGSLMVLYNGGGPIDTLEQRNGISLFASTAPTYANTAAKMAAEWSDEEVNATVYPLNVTVQRPFDWRIAGHRDSIKMTSYPGGVTGKAFRKKLKQGDFETIESPEFVAAAKAAGYDAVLVRDESVFNGFLNVGVFDIRDVMFAIAPVKPAYDYAEALEAKWPRMRRFNLARDSILNEVEQQAEDGIEAASVLRLIAHTGFRVGGNPGLSGKHEAFGATTLKPEHVKIDGDVVSFDFIGKAGVPQKHSIVNPQIARDLEKRMGREKLFDVNDRGMRKFLKAITAGSDFKIHDFRTWQATNAARVALLSLPTPTTPEEFFALQKIAGQAAADKIGDTLKVALESYVDPEIFTAAQDSAGVPKPLRDSNGQSKATDAAGAARRDERAVSAIQASARELADLGRSGGSGTASDSAPPAYGTGIQGSSSAVGYHFSKQSRTSLSSHFYGTGLKGLERERLAGAENADIRPRVFFYVAKSGGVRAEDGVGGHGHRVQLNNLYDVYADPLKIMRGTPNQWERIIKNAGFDGYLVLDPIRPQGFAVLVGSKHGNVPVQPFTPEGYATPTAPPEPFKRGLMSRELSLIDIDAIKEVAPSAKLRTGNFTVDANELDAAKAVLATQGIYFPTELQRSARDVPPATRRELERRRDIMKRLRACLG